MPDDENSASDRAQRFWHDVDAARSHRIPADELWGFSLDDDDDDDESNAECEMPGLTALEFVSDEFAPYASKTVSNPPSVGKGS